MTLLFCAHFLLNSAVAQTATQTAEKTTEKFTDTATDTTTEKRESFRTPAKLYGSAYSIKMMIKRDGFVYDIPVWVKPDSPHSSLDKEQLLELGWIHRDLKTDQVLIANESIEDVKFQNEKAELAYVPNFPKSCCYGIIGQDILKEFKVKFDPSTPAHIEWTKIDEATEKTEVSAHGKPAKKSKPIKGLSSLFSLRERTNTPATLDLAATELTFEKPWVDPKAAEQTLKAPLYGFEFIPPARKIRVTSVAKLISKNSPLKKGTEIISINGLVLSRLDRFEVNELLEGKRSKKLDIVTAHGQTTYDFKTNEFTELKKI